MMALRLNAKQSTLCRRSASTSRSRYAAQIRAAQPRPTHRSAPEQATKQQDGNLDITNASIFLTLTSAAAPALAEDIPADVAAPAGATASAYLLALTPAILYGIFYAYRQFVNPRAKISDFLFILAGLAVFGNIIAILVFKTRLF